jgi:hypothetical protein
MERSDIVWTCPACKREGEGRRVCSATFQTARRLLLAVSVVALGCVSSRDHRTESELARDAELWTKAAAIRVTLNPEQVKGCESLGLIAQAYGEGLPLDPQGRPFPGGSWGEYVLRFKAAQLGADSALMSQGLPGPSESGTVGEAYRCSAPKP